MNPSSPESIVHGYVVVRKPEQSFDEKQRGAFKGGPPCKGRLCYHGLDRMAWFDVDEALFDGTIPANIRELILKHREASSDATGVDLCTSKRDAIELLRFSNQKAPRSELIAVAGDEIAALKGLVGTPDPHVGWLGYDVLLKGGWSLIGDWLFLSGGSQAQWLENLNNYGLLDSPYPADALVRAYTGAAERQEAEEIPGPEYSPMVLRVGRTLVPGALNSE